MKTGNVEYKRKITATLHRRSGKSTVVVWVRRYSKIKNALSKACEIALYFAEPGDVIEFTHSNFEFLIAVSKFGFNKKGFLDFNTSFELDTSTLTEL